MLIFIVHACILTRPSLPPFLPPFLLQTAEMAKRKETVEQHGMWIEIMKFLEPEQDEVRLLPSLPPSPLPSLLPSLPPSHPSFLPRENGTNFTVNEQKD